MTWFDVDLEESGVEQIEKLFRTPPYGIEKIPHATHNNIFVDVSGEQTAIFGYDKKKLVLFYGVIKNLQPEVKQDIRAKLSQVEPLRRELSDELDDITGERVYTNSFFGYVGQVEDDTVYVALGGTLDEAVEVRGFDKNYFDFEVAEGQKVKIQSQKKGDEKPVITITQHAELSDSDIEQLSHELDYSKLMD